MDNLHVDCHSCSARPLACGDCVISVLLGRPDDVAEPVEIEGEERAALDALAASGLVPPLRLAHVVDEPLETPLPFHRRA